MRANKLYTASLALVLMIGLAVIMNSCVKSNVDVTTANPSILNLKVNPNFKFSTTSDVSIKVSTLDNIGGAVPGMRINLYTNLPEKGGALIMSGMTNINGVFNTTLKLPAGTDSLAVGTTAIGFVNMQKVKITAGSLDLVLGGKQERVPAARSLKPTLRATNSLFTFMGTFNSLGVPDYLDPKNDLVDASMLADINATLPEYQSLLVSHPQYFDPANQSNLVLTDAADVWVTFVSEGAGYTNSFGYYKYNVNNPPATTSDIDTIFVAFPNVSFTNSGGGLASGNKVYLGRFAPGTELGWVLISNGYNGKTVTNGIHMNFSDNILNPEIDAANRKHSILLNDIGRGKFLLSFEDMLRDPGTGADNDFNDAIFYVTANPVQSVDITNIPLPNYTSTDSDKDGVSDVFDDYPNDPTKAFNNYYPSQGNVSTLAFEDKWPSQGDYDFNDLVIDYNFNQITNGKNEVVQIKADVTLKAAGAVYINGFGIQIPVSQSAIAKGSGMDPGISTIKTNPNGTEAGQSDAVIIAFDNAYSLLHHSGYAIGVNTVSGQAYVTPKTLNLSIDLSTPVSLSTFGTPPFNPFIFSQSRSNEIQLIDNPPTDLADKSLFGTEDDTSKPGAGRYYVTSGNLPWAIDIAGPFDYPVEGCIVTSAYLNFYDWAASGGTLNYDWYKPLGGYRNTSNVFSH